MSSESPRKPGQQPTKPVPHPNYPNIIFTAVKPRAVAFDSVKELLFPWRAIRQVLGKNDAVVKNEDGTDRLFIDQHWPHSASVQSLRIHCLSIRGVLDSDGSEMANDAALEELFEDWLKCRIPGADGKVETITYGKYVDQQVSKPEFFDADPPAADSATS